VPELLGRDCTPDVWRSGSCCSDC